jgi:O-antigen/teichoic acid export membrane protein
MMTKSPEKESYIWNTIGGILNAAQSVVILMVLSRTLGAEASGIFSIAYATGNLFLTLGNYGVRNYQISDRSEECSFTDYIHHRTFTVSLMILISVIYCFYNYFSGRYNAEKTEIVFLVCLLKSLDSIEEVYEGRLHQRKRLDLAGKWVTLRISVSIGGMILVLIIWKNLAAGIITAIILELLVIIINIFRYKDILNNNKLNHGITAFKLLMLQCFPVCASNFLSNYLTNAPKYAIDGVMGEVAQAQYNYIAMPVFVIQLLNMFIYQPILVRMSELWIDGEYKKFLKYFFKELEALVIISGFVMICAWFLGIPVLSLLYATDLSGLKTEFMILMTGGIFLALNGFFNTVITIMRNQNKIQFVYLAGTIFSLLFTKSLVNVKGILGAVQAYLFIMVIVSTLLATVFIFTFRKGNGENRKRKA